MNSDQKREYQREWVAARRAAWFGRKTCVSCGSDERLEANHIDPSTKCYEPSALWSLSDANPAKQAELLKLEVLCNPCHTDLSRTAVPHGTRSAYSRRGCRCSACRAWNTERVRAQRAHRAANERGPRI